jgi:TPR repeat protein
MNSSSTFEKADELYDQGKYTLAFRMFLALAKGGDVSAMSRLANMYFEGRGTKYSFEKSVEWDIRSAELGNTTSLTNLGVSFRTKGDIRQSKKWFQMAIEAGDDDAALELAKLYLVSDLEVGRVRQLLSTVLSSDRICEDSREEASNLLRELQNGTAEAG